MENFEKEKFEKELSEMHPVFKEGVQKMKHFEDVQNKLRSENPVLATQLEMYGFLMAKMGMEEISPEEVSEKAGFPKDFVSQIEDGQEASLENLVKLADALGLKVSLIEK